MSHFVLRVRAYLYPPQLSRRDPLRDDAIISERRIFHVAAKQRYLILIVGVNLGLAETGFDSVEYLLRSGDAVAGAVRYVDPELAAQRLRNPSSRWSRISPGGRRERRLQRQAGNAS